MKRMVVSSTQAEPACPLCRRQVKLTFHHLKPKKVHRRNFFRKNFSKKELNEGVLICRTCHSGIHRFYDEMHLAQKLDTLEKLQQDDQIQNHARWVSKQKRRY